ncbi:MAG: hypothetical protein HYU56_03235 [Candidatus Aenigmarchaeota archaeon]|nr:hypothetical protein [Candidatus Aenigmarchaeota archaeon]
MIIPQYIARAENKLKKADPERRPETRRRIKNDKGLTSVYRDGTASRNIFNMEMFDDPVWNILHGDFPKYTVGGRELARVLWHKMTNRTMTKDEYNPVLGRKHPVLYPG